MERETDPGPERDIEAPDAAFRARVRSPMIEISAREGYVEATFDMGGEAPATCFFYPDTIDLASSLVGFAESAFQNLEGPALEGRQIARLDVEIRGTRPMFRGDWIYRLKRDDQPIVGLFKLRVGAIDRKGIICTHDEVGYQNTFDRLVGELVDTLTYLPDDRARPYFAETRLLTLGDRAVGVSRTTYTLDPDGDTVIETGTALAIPVGPAEVKASDSYSIELSRPDGTLISARNVEAQGQTIVQQLDLFRDANGIWKVSGIFQEKPVRGEIEQDARVLSTLGQTLLLRSALAQGGAKASAEWLTWAPDADPLSFQTARTKIDAVEGGVFSGRLVVGPLDTGISVFADGTVGRIELDMGGAPLEVERVYAEGEI